MVNHSIFKLVLFLVAAVIFMNTHKLDLNEIRGFGRKKKLLMACYLLGALGIGGIPGWSGYISKTLLHEGIVEYIHAIEGGHLQDALLSAGAVRSIEWIFLISGGLTVAYMCKLFVAVFLEENQDTQVQATFDAQTTYWKPVSAVALISAAVLIPVMGLLPGLTMDRMADMAQGFLGVQHAGHAIHYFTWTNLKGSIISIAIGATIYLLVVRGWMMVKQANGKKSYVNRWPAWIDLEEYLYRPLLIKVLPAILGFVCKLLDNLFDVFQKIAVKIGMLVAGTLNILTDGIVVFLRKTVYQDVQDTGELEEGNALTHVIGVALNRLETLLNKTIWKNHEHRKDLEHWFVLKSVAFKENSTLIGRSLSFGLVLFSIGLCATLIFLLVTALK